MQKKRFRQFFRKLCEVYDSTEKKAAQFRGAATSGFNIKTARFRDLYSSHDEDEFLPLQVDFEAKSMPTSQIGKSIPISGHTGYFL